MMSDDMSGAKPLTDEEIARVQERVASTREWLTDESADLLDDETIDRIVRDEEALLATIEGRDKTIATRDAEVARWKDAFYGALAQRDVAIVAEREACARIAVTVADLATRTKPSNDYHKSRLAGETLAAEEIAAAIRARSDS